MKLLNQKGAEFAKKVKHLKFDFDDAVAELEEDFDAADAKSREDYDNIVDNFFDTANKESAKILSMVIEKIDKYENSFQNRFRECDDYLERRFTEQRELFNDET